MSTIEMKWMFPLILILLYGGCSTMDKSQTGIPGGEFLPCPDSPNCVSSMAEDKSHFIEPLKYEGMSGEDAVQRILTILEAEPRCRVITAEKDSPAYIHAEFRSRIFRFVD